MRILTKELVKEAIELVRPAANKILETEGLTWGPKYVEGIVRITGLGEIIAFDFGDTTPKYNKKAWDPKWGEQKNFALIARAKLSVVVREGMNTSLVVATRPWKLEPGEYLYAGGATRDGISVAISGAKGWVDEALAEMVISAISMLAHLETDKRLEEGKKQI